MTVYILDYDIRDFRVSKERLTKFYNKDNIIFYWRNRDDGEFFFIFNEALGKLQDVIISAFLF